MLIRAVLPMVVMALMGGHEESSTVCEQENALTKALKSKDKAALLALTAGDFHVHISCGSVIRSFDTDVSRQDWIDDLSSLRIASYEATVSAVHLSHVRRDGRELPDSFMASAAVDEIWTVRSPRGGRVEKHFSMNDTWVKLQGTWKLAGRLYRPGPCSDNEHSPSVKPIWP